MEKALMLTSLLTLLVIPAVGMVEAQAPDAPEMEVWDVGTGINITIELTSDKCLGPEVVIISRLDDPNVPPGQWYSFYTLSIRDRGDCDSGFGKVVTFESTTVAEYLRPQFPGYNIVVDVKPADLDVFENILEIVVSYYGTKEFDPEVLFLGEFELIQEDFGQKNIVELALEDFNRRYPDTAPPLLATRTPTPTLTFTPSSTFTPISTPTDTPTPEPTNTPTATATSTITPAIVPTVTQIPNVTPLAILGLTQPQP